MTPSMTTSRAAVPSLGGKFIDAKHEPRKACANFASCAAYIRRKGPQRGVGKDRRISGCKAEVAEHFLARGLIRRVKRRIVGHGRVAANVLF